MSLEAITWALSQDVPHSSAKFVLVVMANYANSDMTCWPSARQLQDATGQDRKTIQENVKRLRTWGYIEDTEGRRGVTAQVIVYRLKEPENGPVKAKRPENGTHPKTDTKRPEIPAQEARNSRETPPKTGDGTSIEPSRNHQEPKEDTDLTARDLVKLGVEEQAAKDWLKVRKAKRAGPLTQTAWAGVCREAAKAGIRPAAAVAMAAERGWQGFSASWVAGQRAPPSYQTQASKRESTMAELTGRNRKHDDERTVDVDATIL